MHYPQLRTPFRKLVTKISGYTPRIKPEKHNFRKQLLSPAIQEKINECIIHLYASKSCPSRRVHTHSCWLESQKLQRVYYTRADKSRRCRIAARRLNYAAEILSGESRFSREAFDELAAAAAPAKRVYGQTLARVNGHFSRER